MIFISRGSPRFVQYWTYLILGFFFSLPLLFLFAGINFYQAGDGKAVFFLILLSPFSIFFFRYGIKVYHKKKVYELEIRERSVYLKYFHKNFQLGEAQIPRSHIKIYYQLVEGETTLHVIRFVHPDGSEFHLDNDFRLWRIDSVQEIWSTIEAMNYPRRLV